MSHQPAPERTIDFALVQHELVALMGTWIEWNACGDRKAGEADVGACVARDAADGRILVQMIIEPQDPRQIIRAIVNRAKAGRREVRQGARISQAPFSAIELGNLPLGGSITAFGQQAELEGTRALLG